MAEINIGENDKLALGNILKAFYQGTFKLQGDEINTLSYSLVTVKEMHKGMGESIAFKAEQDKRNNEPQINKLRTKKATSNKSKG